MDEISQTLEDLIIQTSNSETVMEAQAQLQEYLKTISSLPSFFCLLDNSQNPTIRLAAISYILMIIKANWEMIEDPNDRQQIRDLIFLELNKDILPELTPTLAEITITVYLKDTDEWPSLINFIFENAITKASLVSSLLVGIVGVLDHEVFEAQIDPLYNIISAYLSAESVQIQVNGIRLFNILVSNFENFPQPPELYQLIVQIASASAKYESNSFTQIWSSLNDLISNNIFDIQNNPEIIQIAFDIANSDHLDSNLRMLAITFLVNGIELYQDKIAEILQLCVNVIASTIEVDNILPSDDQLQIFNEIFNALPRNDMYYNYINAIMSSIQQASISQQSVGLLAMSVAFELAPDLIDNNLCELISIIKDALAAEQNTYIHAAAAHVIETFKEDNSSLKVYNIELLNALLPHLVSDSNEVRHHCYNAALTLCDNIDGEVEGFYKFCISITDSVSEDDYTLYLTLVAYAIKLNDSFEEDEINSVIQLLQNVINTQKLDLIASSLSVAHSLIVRESDQFSEVINLIIPYIPECLNYDNSDIVSMAIFFLRDMIVSYHHRAIELVKPHLEIIKNFAANEDLKDDRSRCAAISIICCVVCYNDDNDIGNMFNEMILHILNKSIENDGTELQQTSVQYLRYLKGHLSGELRQHFFKKLQSIVQEHIDMKIIIESLHTITKLVKYCADEERQYYEEKSYIIFDNLMEGKTAFLDGIPIIQVDTSIELFGQLTRFISNFTAFQPNDEVQGKICTFLLQLFEKGKEIQSFSLGTLADFVLNDAFNAQLVDQVFQTVISIVETDCPALQESILYLLNIFLIKYDQYSAQIMGYNELFISWWETANTQIYGYKKVKMNLISIFFALAIKSAEFPNKILVQVLKSLPQKGESTTCANYHNIISLVNSREITSAVKNEIINAIARLFILTDDQLYDMDVDEELVDPLHQLFVTLINKNQNMIRQLTQMLRKSRNQNCILAQILRK